MILDYLFMDQDTCRICLEERTNSFICQSCLDRLEFIDGKHEIEGGIVYYPLFYNNLLKDLVRAFKFQGKTYLLKPLGLILYEFYKAKEDILTADYISYIPMNRKAIFKRGYNQAQLLAEELSNYTGIRLLETVDKVKPTKEQNKLGVKDRRKNLLGSYRVKKGLSLEGKTLLLVDDLVTSGSTLEACGQVILEEYSCQLKYLTLASSQIDGNQEME